MIQPFFASIQRVSDNDNFSTPSQIIELVATVPTLLVPYNDSLSSGLEGRYKSLTDTKVVLCKLIEI
jgi:hypothetical protein